MAPACLKPILEQHGFSSVCFDLNSEIHSKIRHHPQREKFLDFFYHEIVHDEIVEDLSRMINYCADRILEHNPSVVALSLFCYDSQVFAAWTSATIRQKNPTCRIVVGGPGIRVQDKLTFVDKMIAKGYVDDFIIGDGEYAIVEYLKGNLDYPGINSPVWNQNVDISNLPDPDFSDYNFFWYSEPSIPIIDSRGCVRQCEFCDVIEIWKDYQYTTANKTFDQMLRQYQRYGITHFDFRSSISNGNLKEFKKLMALIADYNKDKFSSEQFSWEGSFIIRPESQHTQELWKTLSQTNATLFLGVESIIESVRINLGKNFTNADLDYHLQMAQKYHIGVDLLFIAGYHSETLEDFETVKQWFRDRKQYANNPINEVRVAELAILPYTKLGRNLDNYGITVNNNHWDEWVSSKTGVTVEQRKLYYKELKKIITDECGFTVSW